MKPPCPPDARTHSPGLGSRGSRQTCGARRGGTGSTARALSACVHTARSRQSSACGRTCRRVQGGTGDEAGGGSLTQRFHPCCFYPLNRDIHPFVCSPARPGPPSISAAAAAAAGSARRRREPPPYLHSGCPLNPDSAIGPSTSPLFRWRSSSGLPYSCCSPTNTLRPSRQMSQNCRRYCCCRCALSAFIEAKAGGRGAPAGRRRTATRGRWWWWRHRRAVGRGLWAAAAAAAALRGAEDQAACTAHSASSSTPRQGPPGSLSCQVSGCAKLQRELISRKCGASSK